MGRRLIPYRQHWPILITMVGGAAMVAEGLFFLMAPPASEAQPAMHPTPAPIDGRRAFGYLEQICKIGPRIAGTEANTQQRRMVAEHFRKCGLTVREQPFVAVHPLTGHRVDMANLIGAWHPERLHRLVLCAHYDTRPHADEEINPDRLGLPFIGANDGGSGVALLMEIAHHLDAIASSYGIDLVLFDGEELVYGNNPRRGEYFLGSTIFARTYASQRSDRSRARVQYVGGILFDMVGGKEMVIKREPNSVELAPALVRDVWGVAASLRSRVFINDFGRRVLDDHLPLNEAGIPTIDIIDFDYPRWHTTGDVPEACSGASLAQVGRVLTSWLAVPKPAPRTRRR